MKGNTSKTPALDAKCRQFNAALHEKAASKGLDQMAEVVTVAERPIWRQQLAARIAINALDREEAFWDDVADVQSSEAPAKEAWMRAKRYGPGPRGIYGGPRRETVSRLLLAPAAADQGCLSDQRCGLFALATTVAGTSCDPVGERARTYLPGPAFTESLNRGAHVLASRAARVAIPAWALPRDFRTLLDTASPILLAGPGIPEAWEDDLDELVWASG